MTTKRYLDHSAAIQPCRLKLFTFRSFKLLLTEFLYPFSTPYLFPSYSAILHSYDYVSFVFYATGTGLHLHLWLELRSGHRKPVAFLSKEDLDSRFTSIRLMGAIDRVYRFLCCMSWGDAAKNGTNTSIETNCKSTGSLGRVSATTAPSSSAW